MAGEYSREFSAKVFKGQCKLIEHGYCQGGTAGYGLRRMLVDQNGEPKAQLTLGEQKSLQTDRVMLVPTPPEELNVVREIYRKFLEDRRNEREIADDSIAGAAWQSAAARGLGRPSTWCSPRSTSATTSTTASPSEEEARAEHARDVGAGATAR